MSVDLKKIVDMVCPSGSFTGHVGARVIARQVAEAVCDAAIDKARIRHSELVANDIQTLKRDLCGESKKEDGNG